MNVFEDAVRFLGGSRLKSIIKKYTDTGWKSIFTGFWTTSLLQSSTLLSLLILAFAGAGILTLKSSIWLIFWANIGSPVLPLLVAIIWFGEFQISAFALPLIAIWGIALVFVSKEKYQQIAKLLVGFWLLFLGLDFMQESVAALQSQLDLETYKNLSLWGFGLLGIIATIVIRSSGAIGIMTLAALSSGVITFPAAVAIGMGWNIGTTFTAVISSFGGNRVKRQIAASHVLFNVLSGIIGVIFFWQYIWFTNEVLWFRDNPIMGNAVLNVVFNASTVILFWFFLSPFTKLVERITPARKEKSQQLKVLDATITWQSNAIWFASAKLYALHEDCKFLIDHVATYNAYLFWRNMQQLHEVGEKTDPVSWDKNAHREMYAQMKWITDIMYEHLLPLKQEKLPPEVRKMSEQVEVTISNAYKSSKSIKNIYRDVQNLKWADNHTLKEIYSAFSHQAKELYLHVAAITDREHTIENFEELKEVVAKITKYHYGFVEMISKIVSKKEGLEDIDVPSLININHYVYQSAKTLVRAIQHTYLNEEEGEAFEEIDYVQEKVSL